MSYKESLNKLFQEIEKINSQSNNDTNIGNSYQNNASQFTQNFQSDITKKQETTCEFGFWLSILGLVCSLMGVTYGLFVYIIEFYFAIQGLKTKKRKKAITTIVLSIVSILILVLGLILSAE